MTQRRRYSRNRVRLPPARPASLGIGLLLCALWVAAPLSAWAHPGDLDDYGGHFSQEGVYHYHKPARDMAARKKEYLEWVRYPTRGVIRGVVERIDSASGLWLRIPYRPAYQELVAEVANANRDDRKHLLRVELMHVSPQETGARNPRFLEWFTETVSQALKQKVLGRDVTVQFRIVGGAAGRLRGMVFAGEDNVNLWLVLNGWSYYLLSDGDNPYDEHFKRAEDAARRNKSGVWQFIR